MSWLQGFLRVCKNGEHITVFDNCATRLLAEQIERRPSHWNVLDCGCCHPGGVCVDESFGWDDGSPEAGTVAGGLVNTDPATGGFFVESRSSNRIVESDGAEPLEAFAVFTVIAGSVAGQRLYLDWLTGVLSGADLTMTVFTGCEDAGGGVTTINTDNGFDDVDVGCFEDPPVLTMIESAGSVPTDSGVRQVMAAKFVGLETVDPRLCGGTYRAKFLVYSTDWYSEAVNVAEGAVSDCVRPGVVDQVCVDDSDRCGGGRGISLPDRAYRVRAGGFLTAPQTSDFSLGGWVHNDSDGDVCNVRVSVYAARLGVPSMFHCVGWGKYVNDPPVYVAHVDMLKSGESLSISPSGSVAVVSGGCGSSGGVSVGSNVLGVSERYWVVVEQPYSRSDGRLKYSFDVTRKFPL